MNKFISIIRRAPKRVKALVAIFAAAIIVPAVVMAWGPDRTLFTIEQPASYITFNSITNNPAHGFEPNFMQVREATASNTTYADSIDLSVGKEYVVYMYFHNNAAANLNLVAEGTYAKAQIPAIIPSGSNGTKAVGYVGASNATPKEVWDDISFKNNTGGDIAMRYVPSSATIHSFGAVDGAKLSDNIITSGATLGYSALDGKVPGCEQFAGYVTFRLKADQANFTVEKQVRLAGTTEWKKNIEAKAGDTVEYQIQYKNTGTTEQKNVVVKDTLPKGITYIPGSTYLKNANNPTPKQVSDNLHASTGINIGNYTPGSNAYIKFSAKVDSESKLECGINKLRNVAKVETNNGSKEDDAHVIVTKKCEPPKKDYCPIPGKEHLPKDHPDCKKDEVPETPPELPFTGVGESIAAVIGLGSLTASAGYYISSRRFNQ